MTNDVTAQMLFAFLVDAWNRARDEANTFREQLLADLAAAKNLVAQGSLASVGKNSTNQSYKAYGPGAQTQVQNVETIANLLGLYDQIKSKICHEFRNSADFDYTTPAGFDFDPPIADPECGILTKALLAQISGANTLLPDVTRLRLPPCTILNPSLTTW